MNVIDFKYGQPKIVIGELTPRMDDRDEEVIKCNQLIKEYTEANDRLFLAKHSRRSFVPKMVDTIMTRNT